MDDIPPQLLAKLSSSAIETARAWWIGLTEEDRAAILALCIPDGEPAGAPTIIGGRFLPNDNAAGWDDWRAAYFEHLVAQPDLAFYEPPYFRTFHIG